MTSRRRHMESRDGNLLGRGTGLFDACGSGVETPLLPG